MISTQTKKDKDLANLFILNNPEGAEQQAYIEEIGTLVFQSALMQYLAVLDESRAEEFENFLNQNIGNDTFMDLLCAKYPDFEKILTREMTAFQTEINF